MIPNPSGAGAPPLGPVPADTLPAPQTPEPPSARTRHPFFMIEMIRRQAIAARATHRAVIEDLTARPEATPSGAVVFVGLGTSYHAALGAAHAARHVLPERLVRAVPSFDVLDGELDLRPELAVVFSASGATALTVSAQRRLRGAGTRVVLITSEEGGPSWNEADRILLTQHAKEESWTHTVSYTTALVAAGAVLDQWAGQLDPSQDAGDAVGDAVTEALSAENRAVSLAEEFTGRDRFLLLGSGAGTAPAREGALKLREATGKFVATAGIEEFLHGVIPSLGERTVVLALALSELQRARAEQGLAAAREVGALTALLDAAPGTKSPGAISLPAVRGTLAAAIGAIPIQLLAYWIAVSDGQNPDVMRLDDPRVFRARSSFGI